MTQEFNPRPLFNKHRFITEQLILGNATNAADRASFLIDPNIIKVSFPFIDLIPVNRRREKAKEHFEQALQHLHNMGVE